MKKYIVTGGCGFIGSNFVRLLYENTDAGIVIIDKMTYAADIENIPDNMWDRIELVTADLSSLFEFDHNPFSEDVEAIFHFAAESHVDNSIVGPGVFVDANIKSTLNLLEIAKDHGIKFVHISTDEVYGALDHDDPSFIETQMLAPNNVYSATKVGAEMLVRAYNKTHHLETVVTRCCNNYGPRQHREKLLPKTISNALARKTIPVYGAGDNVREWIHVDDHCSAIWHAANHGESGEVYNIGSGVEITNIEIVKQVLNITDRPESLIKFVEDRKGHDFRYSINFDKMKSIGWTPKYGTMEMLLNHGLPETVDWYSNKYSCETV